MGSSKRKGGLLTGKEGVDDIELVLENEVSLILLFQPVQYLLNKGMNGKNVHNFVWVNW